MYTEYCYLEEHIKVVVRGGAEEMEHNVTAHQSELKCAINSELRLVTAIIAYSSY